MIQCETRVPNSQTPDPRVEKEPGSSQCRAVQAQLGLGPGVRSIALVLRYGITRGALLLTCPRTPALGQIASPSSTHDPPRAVNS